MRVRSVVMQHLVDAVSWLMAESGGPLDVTLCASGRLRLEHVHSG